MPRLNKPKVAEVVKLFLKPVKIIYVLIFCFSLSIHSVSLRQLQQAINDFEKDQKNIFELAETIFRYVEHAIHKKQEYVPSLIHTLIFNIRRSLIFSGRDKELYYRYCSLMRLMSLSTQTLENYFPHFFSRTNPSRRDYKDTASMLYLLYLSCIKAKYERDSTRVVGGTRRPLVFERLVLDAIRNHFFKSCSAFEHYESLMKRFLDYYGYTWDSLFEKDYLMSLDQFIQNPLHENTFEYKMCQMLSELYKESYWPKNFIFLDRTCMKLSSLTMESH